MAERKKEPMGRLTIRLPESLIYELKLAAVKNRTSVQKMAEKALTKLVEAHRGKREQRAGGK
jgi:predicted HicB family RNase H-like nuclease